MRLIRPLSTLAVGATLCLALAACSSSGSGGGGGEGGANFPDDTIDVIVPFAAGGPTDTVTRILAEPLGEELGVQVVVDNVEGAGGTVGAGEASTADPDGYTLLLHHIGMSTAPALYPDLNFDPVEDFEPIGLVTEVPMAILSRSGLGPADLDELVSYIEDNQGSVTLAHAGVGSASHLCGTLLQDALGVELTEVPYDGTGPAMADLLGGQVDLLCDQTTNSASQILAGSVEAYAVTVPERVAVLPEIPTTAEAGLPDVEVSIWHGLYAPAGTPEEVVTILNEALITALGNEEVGTQFEELGTSPVTAEQASPATLATQLDDQIALWGGLLGQEG
ncbi:tripartite tricarboxylate transporter substrate-binding protein [Microbacterium oleivorans]|uniref:tripartite tricarboxylate transporter substrate-binding protein n=1 Tax=Microbacterium oleivorans TaxID=273677 RepID=UPI00203CDC4C|nr:tripartite tricarboxylate transporter substrate-binding protein [Microbacterium oleivorans]MCM3695328.1 tripartite tricarboxylate transporter substrate-binding protein [Microbacterium oleivorans]